MQRLMGIAIGLCLLSAFAAAQEERDQETRSGGPRPEVRARIEAVTAAINSGAPEQWEAMALEHFSPALLAQRNAAERRKLFDTIRAEFGSVTVGSVMRSGPNAPLRLSVTGSSGARGTIELVLDSKPPYKIAGVGIDVGAQEAGSAIPPPPVGPKMSDAEIARALDGYLSRLATDDVFSGVALVAKHGKPIFEKAYGFADRSHRVPNTMTTRFNLGSINKIFTQTAVEQLVARGLLAFDDTVGKHLPDYPEELTRAATITQLLRHEGGIADFFGQAFEGAAKDQFRSNADYYRFVSAQKPLFAPGARSQYCNGCYITLGEIIAKVSGMSYEQYIQQHVFTPAGMTASGALMGDAIEPEVATGYTRRGGPLRSNVYTRGAAGSAAGGGYSTAGDLLAFDRAMKQGTLLDPKRSAEFYAGRGIAGGAPGINAVLESGPTWTVIVLTNLDPSAGESIGVAISGALSR